MSRFYILLQQLVPYTVIYNNNNEFEHLIFQYYNNSIIITIPGQRPAQCSVCGSSFYHEDYLKEHMRLHTGETPFKCPICGRGYAQRGNMKSHLRIHRISELDAVTLSKMRPNYLKLLKV